jgi:hypothetical protein
MKINVHQPNILKKMMNNEPTAIATTKEPIALISYREVVINIEGTYYLENVNVLFGNKIITKIRFRPGEKLYKKGMGKEIAEQYLDKHFTKERGKNKREEQNAGRKKPAVSKAAKQKAAGNLFNDLGL